MCGSASAARGLCSVLLELCHPQAPSGWSWSAIMLLLRLSWPWSGLGAPLSPSKHCLRLRRHLQPPSGCLSISMSVFSPKCFISHASDTNVANKLWKKKKDTLPETSPKHSTEQCEGQCERTHGRHAPSCRLITTCNVHNKVTRGASLMMAL